MTNKISNDSTTNISRRKFLQGGAILGAAVGLAAIPGNKNNATEEVVKALGTKELDAFPHEIASDYERFNPMNMAFMQAMVDPEYGAKLADLPGLYGLIDDSKPGFTTIDYNLMRGAWGITNDYSDMTYDWNYFINKAKEDTLSNMPTPQKYGTMPYPAGYKRYEFANKSDATKVVKKAAKFYGADLVGICAYDEKWMYKPIMVPGGMADDSEMPFTPKSVIVMAFEMDYEAVGLAPATIMEAEMGRNYSKMCEVTHKLATMLSGLGYLTFAAGNDKALSVPLAIAAGLGEQGRSSILITKEYGPRVRLCKVFTEMELNYDKPIEFGANKFCQVCKKCAEKCPSQSISYEDEMTWEGSPASVSNQTGVKKYYVDLQSCYVYWSTVGNGCGCCIAACPYNKPEFWHHRLTTALTSTPLKPFLNEMDDLFGYGDIFDEKGMEEFWDLDVYTTK